MILAWGVAALVVLALITQAGVVVLQRAYPAQGRMIDVEGARLHVLELGPRDASGPVTVMIHGASSNIGSMRVPLGDRLAKTRRVILIDRPGHGWSTRENLETSTPATQAKMLDQPAAEANCEDHRGENSNRPGLTDTCKKSFEHLGC